MMRGDLTFLERIEQDTNATTDDAKSVLDSEPRKVLDQRRRERSLSLEARLVVILR